VKEGCVLKAAEKWGVGGKVVRESNGWGWTDQSKVYPQWGHIETPLWTST
jgi:hypothetical protein